MLLIVSLSDIWYLIIASRQPEGIKLLIKNIIARANATKPKSSGASMRAV